MLLHPLVQLIAFDHVVRVKTIQGSVGEADRAVGSISRRLPALLRPKTSVGADARGLREARGGRPKKLYARR